jgi:hypothetical protein
MIMLLYSKIVPFDSYSLLLLLTLISTSSAKMEAMTIKLYQIIKCCIFWILNTVQSNPILAIAFLLLLIFNSRLWLFTNYYFDLSIISNLSDNIMSLSDKLVITSSFILSFSLNTWLISCNSSILVSKSAPCLFNCCILEKLDTVRFSWISRLFHYHFFFNM